MLWHFLCRIPQPAPRCLLQSLQVVQAILGLRLAAAPQEFREPTTTTRKQTARHFHGLATLPFPVLHVSVRHRERSTVAMAYQRGTVRVPPWIKIMYIEIIVSRCLAHIDKDRTLGRTGAYDIRQFSQFQYSLADAFAESLKPAIRPLRPCHGIAVCGGDDRVRDKMASPARGQR